MNGINCKLKNAMLYLYLLNAITKINATQQPSSQISQSIHHKKAE